MRRSEIDLHLTPALKNERRAKQLTLLPDLAALHDLGSLVESETPKRPKLWLVHEDEIDYPDFYIRRDDKRGIRAVVNIIDEKIITEAVAKALHEKTEARRLYNHRVLGNLAAMGWGGGSFFVIGGTSAESGLATGIAAAAVVGGGALEWYKATHPFEPRPMSELRDATPVVRVLPTSQQ